MLKYYIKWNCTSFAALTCCCRIFYVDYFTTITWWGIQKLHLFFIHSVTHLMTSTDHIHSNLLSLHLPWVLSLIFLISCILTCCLVFISLHRSSIFQTFVIFISSSPFFIPIPSLPHSKLKHISAFHFHPSLWCSPSLLNYVSHQGKQRESKCLTQTEK